MILLVLWQKLFTDIKIFVLVTLAIFGIGHYRGHLCFRNTFLFLFSSQKTIRLNKIMVIHPFAKCGMPVSKNKDDFAWLQTHRDIMILIMRPQIRSKRDPEYMWHIVPCRVIHSCAKYSNTKRCQKPLYILPWVQSHIRIMNVRYTSAYDSTPMCQI